MLKRMSLQNDSFPFKKIQTESFEIVLAADETFGWFIQ